MNWLIVKNDFIRNRTINLALFLFMMLAAGLAVLSVVMAGQTFTSIAQLYETAQPPHFLQMHKGEIDQGEIDEFMSGHPSVLYWQTETMINIYGENLTVAGQEQTYHLADLRLDIGLVKQNAAKDLLLNSAHEKVILQDGEIGIPVILKGRYDIQIGDRVILAANEVREEFTVKEFVLDAQMNSTMASSTRILLSDGDFDRLSGQVGEHEYLIEAYFANTSEAADFQTAYQDAGLPQNGQAVTYAMIFLLSAFTDVVTVFVLLLVSLLLIMVAFICVKFTIMAALEEEVAEIGTMKAIGLTFADIRDLYLNKYRVLALAGVIAGYTVALLSASVFTRHISTTFGDIRLSPWIMILALVVGCLVYLLIIYYCKKILQKIKNVTVVGALVRGEGFENDKGIKDGLHKARKISVNWLMALREVFYRFKNWTIVFAVVLIAVMMIMVPVNLLTSFEAPGFITYMGSSLEDILIEVENGENLENGYARVKQVLEQDTGIEDYYEYRTVRVKTTNSQSLSMNLDIECGDNAGNGLQYLSGRAPQGENEVAISYLNAEEIGKEAGESIVLFWADQERPLEISGVYQDVTSGGLTAKSKYNFPELAAHKYTFSVDLHDKSAVEKKAAEWTELVGGGVTVDPMQNFISQTLGGVTQQLRNIVGVIFIIGACLVMLITVLFLKLRLAKDSSAIAILQAIGFSEGDIKQQYMIKIGSVSILGILGGIIATNLLGERIVNAALGMAGLGVKQIKLITNPVVEYIICPLVLMTLILLMTWIVMRSIKKYHIVSMIKE